MSDPPKVIVKNKVTIVTDSDEENASGSHSRHQTPLRQRSLNRSTSKNSDDVETGDSRRRSRRSTRRSDSNNAELITLQETAKKSQPVTLKASFLRRKIKEYEGKDENE